MANSVSVVWGEFKPRAASVTARKLTLDKGEQSRVSYIESQPQIVYVHSFEKVVTGPDGKPIIEHDEWQDGSPREKTKTEYAGKLACLGDVDELQRSGADPERCPACRGHIENPNAIRRATRRIVGHVLKYSTRAGSFTPVSPFSASLLAWDLTENRFEELNNIYKEHGSLAEKDLLLGPCENKMMQKYTIAAGNGEALWRQSEATIAYVTELINSEKIEDIASVAAKVPSEFEMSAKVNEVVRAYNHAFNIGANQVSNSYESLLQKTPTTQQTAAPVQDEAPAEPTASAEAETAEEAPAVEVKSDNKTASLEQLLNAFNK